MPIVHEHNALPNSTPSHTINPCQRRRSRRRRFQIANSPPRSKRTPQQNNRRRRSLPNPHLSPWLKKRQLRKLEPISSRRHTTRHAATYPFTRRIPMTPRPVSTSTTSPLLIPAQHRSSQRVSTKSTSNVRSYPRLMHSTKNKLLVRTISIKRTPLTRRSDMSHFFSSHQVFLPIRSTTTFACLPRLFESSVGN